MQSAVVLAQERTKAKKRAQEALENKLKKQTTVRISRNFRVNTEEIPSKTLGKQPRKNIFVDRKIYFFF